MQQLTRTKGWRAGEPHLVVMAAVAFSLLLVDADKASTGIVPAQTTEEKTELPFRLCWSKTHSQETEFFIRLTKGLLTHTANSCPVCEAGMPPTVCASIAVGAEQISLGFSRWRSERSSASPTPEGSSQLNQRVLQPATKMERKRRWMSF